MTRIIGLLSWYDEQPSWLHKAILSCDGIIDHLIALDGAYSLFPHPKAASPPNQKAAINAAGNAIGATVEIITPDEPWQGNETQKRTQLFRHGDETAEPGKDWFLILDADERVTTCPPDLHEQLEMTPFDVAQVTFNEPQPNGKVKSYPIPILFRANPGIYVEGDHYTYRTTDGRYLWGNANLRRLEPRHLTSVEVLHLTHQRQARRHNQQYAYYRKRDKTGLEALPCQCGKPSTRDVYGNFRPDQGRMKGQIIQCCDTCAREVHIRNQFTFMQYGIDYPEANEVEIGIGPA